MPYKSEVVRHEGTRLQRLALGAQTGEFKKIIEWVEPDGSTFEQRADGSWTQRTFGGAVGVVESFEYAVSSDREMGALNTQTSDTWTEEEDIRKVIITAIGTVGGSCVVCFDAPDTATATNWLSGNTTAGEPTLRRVVKVGVPREFNFKYPLRRVDAIDLVGTVTNLFIEAGK